MSTASGSASGSASGTRAVSGWWGPAERQALKGRAHKLDPVVWIGAQGLSHAVVAEVERGRRRHVMTRARIAETLASVAAEKGISLDTGTSVAV